MAIALRAAGTWVATSAASQSPVIPTAQVTGDMMILIATGKPYNLGWSVATSGWTSLGRGESGTTAAGVDAGSMVVEAWYKVALSDTETNPTVTEGSPVFDVIQSAVCVFSKGAGETWSTPVIRFAADETTGTAISVNFGTDPGGLAGDYVMLAAGINTDAMGPLTTDLTPLWTGITFGTADTGIEGEGTTGGDMAAHYMSRPVSSGTSSAAPTATGTGTASGAVADRLEACFIRLRVSAAVNADVSLTTIAAQGAVSTPTVTVPISRSNSAEGGTDGVTVTLANSAGASGDALDVGGSAAAKYSNAHPATGSMGIDLFNAVGQVNLVRFTETFGQTIYGRSYLYIDVLASTIEIGIKSAAFGQLGSVEIRSDGKVYLLNAASSTVGSSTAVLAVNTLYRIEFKGFSHASTGTMEARIYAGHSSTALETISASSLNTSGTAIGIVWMALAAHASTTAHTWIDDFNVNTTDFPGPSLVVVDADVSLSTVAAIATVPSATIAANADITLTTIAALAAVSTPTNTADANLTLTTVVATASIDTPGVVATSPNADVTPSTVVGIAATPVPEVIGNANAPPDAVAAQAAVLTPVVAGNADLTPITVTASNTVPTPTITTEASADVSLSTVAAQTVVPTPSVSVGADVDVTPTTVPSTSTVPTPSVAIDVALTTSTVVGSSTIPVPSATGTAEVTPSTVVGVAAVPTPTISAIQSPTITLSTVTAQAAIETPNVVAGGNINITTSTVAAQASIPSASVAIGVELTTEDVSAAAAVYSPSTSANADITLELIVAQAKIPPPNAFIGEAAQPVEDPNAEWAVLEGMAELVGAEGRASMNGTEGQAESVDQEARAVLV